MSTSGVIFPTVRVLSILMLVGMVANPNLCSFVIDCVTRTHASYASVAVTILFLVGVLELAVGFLSLVLLGSTCRKV